MSQDPFLHEASGSVRFWVPIDQALVGASIRRETLHYLYKPRVSGDDPLATYHEHCAELHAAVQRRVAGGSREPVMLREADLPGLPRR